MDTFSAFGMGSIASRSRVGITTVAAPYFSPRRAFITTV